MIGMMRQHIVSFGEGGEVLKVTRSRSREPRRSENFICFFSFFFFSFFF